MKPRSLLLFSTAALWWLPAVSTRAEQPAAPGYVAPDPFDTLQKALRAEREARAHAPGGGAGSGAYYETRGYMENIRESLAQGEDAAALNALNQLEAIATTEEVRRACEALVDKINKDHAAKLQAFNVELEVAAKRAGDAVLRAKDPKELDGLIEEFNRLSERQASQNLSGRDNRTAQKFQGINTFLCRWQDYLTAMSKGEEQNAGNFLRNLTENNYNQTVLVPRSEILARLPDSVRNRDGDGSSARSQRTSQETNAAVAAILDETHSLDEVPAALTKLDALAKSIDNQNRTYDNSTDLGAAIANLQSLQKTQNELRAGLATTISFASLRSDNGNSRPTVDNHLAGLRAELLKLALPRLLGASETSPNADEGAAEFLRRLIDAAKQRGDWAAVARGLEINRSFATSQSNYSSANAVETEAFKSFFSGLNLEAAGQYQQAVIAYLTALKSGVQDLPAATIGEHLATIEKGHPKDFTDANTYVLNPPAPQYPNSPYGPGPRGAYDPRFNRPNYPGAPEQPTPPPAVAVPAVTPAASAAPVVLPSPVPKPSP